MNGLSHKAAIKKNLKRHIARIHEGKKLSRSERRKNSDIKFGQNYFCRICDKEVVNDNHKKKYHNSEDGNLKCPKCERVFPNFVAGWFTFVLYFSLLSFLRLQGWWKL